MKKKIRVVLVATNAYFLLGIRLINRWKNLYSGNNDYIFHFISDKDPKEYLYTHKDAVIYENIDSSDWFSNNMLRIEYLKKIAQLESDYVICIDADTNVENIIVDDLFLYDTFFLQHVGREYVEINNDKSVGYMNFSNLEDKDFVQACFFGGIPDKVINMCDYVIKCLDIDRPIGKILNNIDETYLTKYFYINQGYVSLKRENLPFFITDKGDERPSESGWNKTPFYDLSDEEYENLLLEVKNNHDKLFNIRNNKIILEDASSYGQ